MGTSGVRKKSLRTEFFLAVCVTLLCVACVSAVTILGCWRFRKWLVPDENYVMIRMEYLTPNGTEGRESWRFRVDGGEQAVPFLLEAEDGEPVSEGYDPRSMKLSVESVDYGIGRKGPRRKLAYIWAGIAMGVLPAVYSAAGFFLCAMWFYRKKLSPAITVLDDAAKHIGRQDLDFTVSCGLDNELGGLCRSFEQMRQALSENNRRLWKMIEERKLLQASVAHDLRNPIAIIEGYAEYLQIHMEADGLPAQRIREIAGHIDEAANRLEQYTESVRYLNRLEDMELHRTPVNAPEFARKMTEDFQILAKDAKIRLEAKFNLPGQDTEGTGEMTVTVDRDAVYRIAENLMNNALRFARRTVRITFGMAEDASAPGTRFFTVEICDDGPGFSEELLKENIKLFAHASKERGHSGLGLPIAKLLCEKHGGRLELANGGENTPGGGSARAFIKT